MRHNRQTHRLGRNHNERQAMLENLVTSLLKHQQIRTTLQKAKAAQRLAEHVITLGKDDSLASRRRAFSYLQDHQLTSKLFKDVAPRFKARKGGYTRILHLDRRKGDGAQLALLELTEKEAVKETKVKKKAAKGKAHDHEGHEHHAAHGPHVHEGEKTAKGHAAPAGEEKEAHAPKKAGEKPQKGFFKNIGKFFRNKGGG
ncbi:MAG TPA: 50S ribosomal protein L17 [Candidatus Eisenbacteria bacterium]|nr:50S ribosomal protein L17 [Candidatus Eisenbacteria bacterium]